ncbi:hypothetical protein [Oceanimonas smirnovii]|uniref:hypothetical protein n=1 Tax=Oceanimonas smirnovii TaxID=264574 RepID=UPI0037706742
MKKLKSLTMVMLAVASVGCVVSPRDYDSEQSRALNLARAGDIYDMDLRDSKDGTSSYSKGIFGSLLKIASLATSFDAPLRHLSGTQTLMFNATDIMMTPDKPSARPSLMGWMPASMATSEAQAREQYVELVDQAILQAAKDMALNATKLNNVKTPAIDGHPLMLWSIESAEHGCDVDQCMIAYNIKNPYYWKTPSYIEGGEPESYNIAANHPKKYSRFIFRQSGEQLSFPMDKFYRTVSGSLPSWMVMYFPPNTVAQNGELLPYPVMYEQGQQLMFKEPNHE